MNEAVTYLSRARPMPRPAAQKRLQTDSGTRILPDVRKGSCALCGRMFKPRSNKRYCSNRCRFKAWASGRVDDCPPCYYCGMPAEGVDHVPPKSVRPVILAERATRWTFLEVDACNECNSLLGAQPPWTVQERKAAIKDKLRRRYARYLKIPEWSDKELSEHDPRTLLGSFIHEGITIKRAIELRLKW